LVVYLLVSVLICVCRILCLSMVSFRLCFVGSCFDDEFVIIDARNFVFKDDVHLIFDLWYVFVYGVIVSVLVSLFIRLCVVL